MHAWSSMGSMVVCRFLCGAVRFLCLKNVRSKLNVLFDDEFDNDSWFWCLMLFIIEFYEIERNFSFYIEVFLLRNFCSIRSESESRRLWWPHYLWIGLFFNFSYPIDVCFFPSTWISQRRFWVSVFFSKEMSVVRFSRSRLVYPKSVLGHITSFPPPQLNLCSDFEKYTGILCIISAKSPFAAT